VAAVLLAWEAQAGLQAGDVTICATACEK
jgi:hypothetical protein